MTDTFTYSLHYTPSTPLASTRLAPKFPRNPIYCYLETMTLNASLIIFRHLSLSCHLLPAGCITYLCQRVCPHPATQPQHTLGLSRPSQQQEGEWQVGGRPLEMGVCFPPSAPALTERSGKVYVIKPQEPLAHLRQTLVSSATKGAVFKALNKGHYYQAVKVRKCVKPFNLKIWLRNK